MARRRLTVKRIDPWSMLKFGVVVNLALLAVGLLVATVVWMVIDRLQLVDQACSIALDVGFTACGVNAGNLFRALILLGLLGVVVQTAVFVFLAFLYNLIADLTGGLTLGVVDEGAVASRTTGPSAGARRRPRREPVMTEAAPERRAEPEADPHPAPQPARRSSAVSETDEDLFGPR
ncbi:DUF3566 domain-containing protein [Egicoccus halophilus]|uniref:DUF3566 domain-containing protein n=1 Tax=Egicoccus halophilus TaxID=1670830 RepID=A0A8J3AAJ3_9ACTN|nr:DUF3566 domain-containing protein [Egicoccus halophilus]GGI03075.1 hypothetical protein GCM10011354_02530 [Egicoccus halophilus]